ncbi:hypothetical protein ACWIGI_37590 [Nocardia sp. NPDC055321]
MAAELMEPGQHRLAGRLTRALSDMSQSLKAYSIEPNAVGTRPGVEPARKSDTGKKPTVMSSAPGEYAKHLRQLQGLSSEKASDVLGWETSDIRLFELGYFEPDKSNIRRLLQLYEVTEQKIHREFIRVAENAE